MSTASPSPEDPDDTFGVYRARFGRLDLTWLWLQGPAEWQVATDLLRKAVARGEPATDRELFATRQPSIGAGSARWLRLRP